MRFTLLFGLLAALSFSAPIAHAQNQGRIVGVGLGLKSGEDGGVWIESVIPNSPAERAGIKAGDQIVSINDKAIRDLALDDVPAAMHGDEGTELRLGVRSGDAPQREISLRRETIILPALPQDVPQLPATNAPQQPPPPAELQQPPAPRPAPIADPTPQPPQPAPAPEPVPPPEPAPAAEPAPAPAPPPPADASTLRFQRVSIHDSWVNNIEAGSILVPKGWKYKAAIAWDPNTSGQATVQLRILDPQTGAEIEFLPQQNYVFEPNAFVPMQPGANYMGNIICQPITDLPQYVQAFLIPSQLQHLSRARVADVVDLPKVTDAVQQSAPQGSQVKCGRVRYEYVQNGQAWEEDVSLTMLYTPNPALTLWSCISAISVRAPKGDLDRMTPLLTSITQTFRVSPEWFMDLSYVRTLFGQRMMSGIQGAAAISNTISANAEEIRRDFAESYKQAAESEDRISQSVSETTRGVNTYADPFEERPVELPSGYNDAWVNGKGEYILSNVGGFDPNVGATTEWRRMNQRGERP